MDDKKITFPKIFEKINIKPQNINLYYEALTHNSFVNETREGQSYQRLEFVGDALLSLEVALFLFDFKNIDEGQMTLIRANLVNSKALSKYSSELGLPEIMRVGKGAKNIKSNIKIQADLFEALIAAIYFDQGPEKMREFLKFNILNDIKDLKNQIYKNPKTQLQEILQSFDLEKTKKIQYLSLPKENNNLFTSKVFFNKTFLAKGIGKTKKDAEIQAAQKALKNLKPNK